MKMTKTKITSMVQISSPWHPQVCTTPNSEWVGEYHCHNLHNKTGEGGYKNQYCCFPKETQENRYSLQNLHPVSH